MSIRSVLSHTIRANRAFLISANCSKVNEWGWPPNSYQKLNHNIASNKRFNGDEEYVGLPVPSSGVAKLRSDDACKSGSHHRTRQRTLRNSTRPQINILWVYINLRVSLHSDVVHGAKEVIPTSSTWETTVLPGF